MVFGVAPPTMGTVARNRGQAAEFLYDFPLYLFRLAGRTTRRQSSSHQLGHRGAGGATVFNGPIRTG
jgi:hypothetical protein